MLQLSLIHILQRAVDWGEQMFKAAGADSVHTEEFTIPYSWSEGATEMTVSATGTAPVSYTHLDVYKRQNQPGTVIAVDADGSG